MNNSYHWILSFLLIGCFTKFVNAQGFNPIPTSFQSLMVTPDTRAAGMGNTGTATSATSNAIFWNPGKIVFNQDKLGVSLSYASLYKNLLINNANLGSFAGYYKLSDKQAISISARYFDYGKYRIQLGSPTFAEGDFKITDRIYSLAYSRKLNKNWGIGVTGSFIQAITKNEVVPDDIASRAHHSLAFDIGVFHSKPITIAGNESQWSFGASIMNFGSKTSYPISNIESFIPITLSIGNTLSTQFSTASKLSWTVNISKLMVPTPGVNFLTPYQGSSLQGALESFGDAPGGLKEEFQELIWSSGLEYTFEDFLALRAGYYHEHENKGNVKYITLGAGLKTKKFRFDVAYFINRGSTLLQNPREFRASVSFGI
ncbi:hypothetical protein BKI52_06565 [marine bacterium AO1-C]|nr:hypothetical protein BKI52_06565 [marine bacterium AO1-C]